jgi:hypothetical protein
MRAKSSKEWAQVLRGLAEETLEAETAMACRIGADAVEEIGPFKSRSFWTGHVLPKVPKEECQPTKIELPKQIKVGHRVYRVLFPYQFTERSDISGQACHCTLVIRIADVGSSGERYADEVIMQCFWHEVLHCIDHVYNNSEAEERTIDMFASGLCQVMNDMGLI